MSSHETDTTHDTQYSKGFQAKEAVRLQKPYLQLDKLDLLQEEPGSRSSWSEQVACISDNGTILGRYSYALGKTKLYVDYRLIAPPHANFHLVDAVEIMQRENGDVSQHAIVGIETDEPILLAGSLDFSDFDRAIALRSLAHNQTTKREVANVLKSVLELSEFQKLRISEPPKETAIFPQK